MANSNNWGEIYNSTWWGDEDWSANSLKIDSAPPGFAGQNLLLGSEELNKAQDGQWIQRLISSVTADDEVAPIGGETTAEQVAFTANKQSRIEQLVTLVAGTQYTFSVWAKATGASPQSFRLSYYDNTAGSGAREDETAPTSWDASTGRATMTFTAASSGTYWMRIQNASAGAAQSIYFWGAMLNEGAAAGDYIKTTFAVGPTDPPVANAQFGDNFGRVSAYYSLRQFTTAEDTNAIRVRRSSDDTEQDIGFDANGDLDTTALTTFVNEETNAYTSDFSSGTDTFTEHSTTNTGNIDGVSDGTTSKDDVLRVTMSGGNTSHQIRKANIFDGANTYDISFEYYIPSSNTKLDQIVFRTNVGGDGDTTFSNVGAWTTGSISDFTPSGTQVRFNATDGGAFIFDADGDVFYLKNIVVTQTTADGFITKWYDQSGNSNDAINADASAQPLVVSGGTLVTENDKAAIDFDGVDDYFTGAAKTTMNDTAIFAVIKSDSNTQDSVFIQNTLDASNFVALGLGGLGTSNAIGSRLRVGGSTVDSVGDSTFTATDQTLVSYLADNTAGQMFVDGTEETDAVDSRSGGTATTIGARGDGNNPFNGAFQEVIFFDSDQSANRTGIETNINDHFSIYP